MRLNYPENQMATLQQWYRAMKHWCVGFTSSLTDEHTTQSNMDVVVVFGIISINMVCVLVFYILQGGNDVTYVCFNKNGALSFAGALLNNGKLTRQNVRNYFSFF